MSSTVHADHSQHPPANQGGDGIAGAGIYAPPCYESIEDLRSSLRTRQDTPNRQYEVLEQTPEEPRHEPSISQVTADIAAHDYDKLSPVPFVSSQEVGSENDYSHLQHQ